MGIKDKLAALGANAVNVAEVDVTVNGVTEKLRIRKMNFLESQHITAIPFAVDSGGRAVFKHELLGERNVAIVAACLLGDDDKPALTKDEVAALAPDVGAALVNAVNEVNGFTPKAVEEAAKNSTSTPS